MFVFLDTVDRLGKKRGLKIRSFKEILRYEGARYTVEIIFPFSSVPNKIRKKIRYDSVETKHLVRDEKQT